jgi:hypothetical protein
MEVTDMLSSTRLFIVAAIMILVLLMLATNYPKYVMGFMFLVLFMVLVTHADIVTSSKG